MAAVLARADADAHRARVMAAKLEVYEGAFLHDAPAIGADPTTAAGVARGLLAIMELLQPGVSRELRRARGLVAPFKTVGFPRLPLRSND